MEYWYYKYRAGPKSGKVEDEEIKKHKADIEEMRQKGHKLEPDVTEARQAAKREADRADEWRQKCMQERGARQLRDGKDESAIVEVAKKDNADLTKNIDDLDE